MCVLSGWCVPGGSRGLLKLSQHGSCWQAGKSWKRYWGICFSENNGRTAVAILDSSYRKCYNQCNDDNNNVISHQIIKFAPYGVFAFMGIKSHWTAENAVQRIYIKYGNTKTAKMCAVGGQREKSYLYIQKGLFVKSVTSGYKIVIILPIAFPLWWW